MSEREEYFKKRAKDSRASAIRFKNEDEPLGIDILLQKGPVTLCSGGEWVAIYVTSRRHIESVLPDLERLRLDYEINFRLPVPLRFQHLRRLWELEGWERPKEGNYGSREE